MAETRPIEDSAGRVIGREWTCQCGCWVDSFGGRDTWCDRCGQDYNAFGQPLNPPHMWDEPQGETVHVAGLSYID